MSEEIKKTKELIYDFWIVAGKLNQSKTEYIKFYVRPYAGNHQLGDVVRMSRSEVVELIRQNKRFMVGRYDFEEELYKFGSSLYLRYNTQNGKYYLFGYPYDVSRDLILNLPEEVPDEWG